jgi:hypothetical protein
MVMVKEKDVSVLIRTSFFRIAGLLDFVHRPVFLKLENTFRKLDLFPFSGEGGAGKTPTLLGPLETTNHIPVNEVSSEYVCFSPPSPEHENRSSFRNVVFYSF